MPDPYLRPGGMCLTERQDEKGKSQDEETIHFQMSNSITDSRNRIISSCTKRSTCLCFCIKTWTDAILVGPDARMRLRCRYPFLHVPSSRIKRLVATTTGHRKQPVGQPVPVKNWKPQCEMRQMDSGQRVHCFPYALFSAQSVVLLWTFTPIA